MAATDSGFQSAAVFQTALPRIGTLRNPALQPNKTTNQAKPILPRQQRLVRFDLILNLDDSKKGGLGGPRSGGSNEMSPRLALDKTFLLRLTFLDVG
jgi:hypothetical protein